MFTTVAVIVATAAVRAVIVASLTKNAYDLAKQVHECRKAKAEASDPQEVLVTVWQFKPPMKASDTIYRKA